MSTVVPSLTDTTHSPFAESSTTTTTTTTPPTTMSQPSTGFAVAETPFATNTRNRRSSSAQKQQQQQQQAQQGQRGTAAKQAQTSGGRRGGGGAVRPLPPLTGVAAKLAKQRAKEAAIADAGGLIFDATGKPVFLPQGVASFYGDVLMRPFIKLDAATGKPVLDRPFQPKLPNAPLIGACGRACAEGVRDEKGGRRGQLRSNARILYASSSHIIPLIPDPAQSGAGTARGRTAAWVSRP